MGAPGTVYAALSTYLIQPDDLVHHQLTELMHHRHTDDTAGLLAARGQRPRVIVLFSGTGFTPELRNVAAASGSRIQLVDLERLYTGS